MEIPDLDKYDTTEKRDQCRALLQCFLSKKKVFSPRDKLAFLSSFQGKQGSARIMIDSGLLEENLIMIDYSDQGEIPFSIGNFPKSTGIASPWDDAIVSLPKDGNGMLKDVAIVWLDHVLMPETAALLESTHQTMNVCGKGVLFVVNTVLHARHRNYNGEEGAPGIIGAGRDQFFRSLREKMGSDGDRWFSIEPQWTTYRQYTARQDMGIYLFWSEDK